MNLFKKIISVSLAVILTLAVLPFTVSAEDKLSGEFKCAWFNETLTYPYEYSDDYFYGSSLDYNHDLATYALSVAMASFNSFDKEHGDEHVAKLLTECGFTVDSYGYDTENYDTIGVAFGRKSIDDCNVIIAAIRSGNYGMEWGGNLRVGSGTGDHEGFHICRDLLIGYLNTYFKEHPCEGKTKILIPGYSRGASAANLLAAALDDGTYKDVLEEKDYIAEVSFDEIYAYTFEAPQCTTNPDVHSRVYANIFNIVNPNDYVPMFVMDEWGFSLYGNRIEMPCADNCENYDIYYDRVCETFDSFMGPNDRKAKNVFYNKEDSLSAETTLNYIFKGLGEDVMKDREFFHKNYEGSLVFFAGQYLGRQRKAKDFFATMGRLIAANAISVTPSNLSKIKSDGYRKYISKYIASHNGGELSENDIEGTINVLTELLSYINANRKDVVSLMSQLHTVAEVHQPYVAFSWMKALNVNDIRAINDNADSLITLSCKSMKLKYDVNGKIVARYSDEDGHVEWKSDNTDIVTVDSFGVVHTTGDGTATVTASLVSNSGEIVAQQKVSINVKLTFSERITVAINKLFR